MVVTRRILVCDGEQRTALAAVRSLGRAGYAPVVLSAVPDPLAGTSRYAAGSAVVADPLRDPEGFARDVREAAVRFDAALVLPTSEQSMLALSAGRELGALRVIGPDGGAFRRVSNKQVVLAEAPRFGIAVPRQVVVQRPGKALAEVLESAPYPAVIKSTVSVAGGQRSQTLYAEDAHELEAVLRGLSDHHYPLLVQERIVGAGEGVFVLLHEGRLVASFSHRRIREYPPAGGRSVCAVSTALDTELLDRSVALLRHLGWDGPAMVEYKRDRRTGRATLMEVNARLWGSLQLAIDAGVDFPVLMVRAALGEPLPDTPPPYRVGLRLRSFWGDLDHLLSRFIHRRRDLRLDADAPGVLGAIGAFLAPRPRQRWESFRWADPKPFFAEGARWFRGLGHGPGRTRPTGPDTPPVLVLGTSITALGVMRICWASGRRAFHFGENRGFLRLSRSYRRAPGQTRGGRPGEESAERLRRLPLARAVLMPCSDNWLRDTSALEPALQERFPSFLPTSDVIDLMTDKARFAELTHRLGVPHPRTWPIGGIEDLAEVPESALATAFLKPRDSQAFFQRYGAKAFWIHSRGEAELRLRDLAPTGLAMQLQEYVPGPPTAHYFLDGFADATGRVRALLARQRLRMYPRDFGNSSAMRTVPLSEVRPAVEWVERLVGGTGYRGVFSAEFKRDERDGVFRVLELNARPWWYVEFAARCGVDVCAWAYQAALDLPPPAPRAYRLGAVCTYPYYDFYAVRSLRREGKASWSDFVRTLVGAQQPVFRWSDPLPGLWEVTRVVSQVQIRLARRRQRPPERRRMPRSGSGGAT